MMYWQPDPKVSILTTQEPFCVEEVQARLIHHQGFVSNVLGHGRDVWVYLPRSYAASQQRYPVLYMQDGQHAFFADEYGESWDAHLMADLLSGRGWMREIIIVAIGVDRDQRLQEYFMPHPNIEEVFGAGAIGHLYETFLVHELKPFIDRTYRTLPDARNTALLGASAGGVCCYNLAFRRPEVFGNAAVMSPCFVRVCAETLQEIPLQDILPYKVPIRLYLDVGAAEGLLIYPEHVREVALTALKAGFVQGEDLWYYEDPRGGHFQQHWAARLHNALLFFFGQKGTFKGAMLFGPAQIRQGQMVHLNAVVYDDRQCAYTDLQGRFSASRTVQVFPDGRVQAVQEGTGYVSYQQEEHYELIHKVRVLSDLPEAVPVHFDVQVPEKQCPTDQIWAGVPLPHLNDNRFGGTVMLPLHRQFSFRIAAGWTIKEVALEGRPLPVRQFQVREGLKLQYQVLGWSGHSGA